MQTKKNRIFAVFLCPKLANIKKDGFHLALPCHALHCPALRCAAPHRATSIPVPQAQLLMPEATINDVDGPGP